MARIQGNANLPIGPDKTRALWHDRLYIPHFDGPAITQHITIHLSDSLPRDEILSLHNELMLLPKETRNAWLRIRLDNLADAGYGSCVLQEPSIAGMVQQSLLKFNSGRYQLFAWVIMPNHVHVLLQPKPSWSVAEIVGSWKKFTARRICEYRRASGNVTLPVWHREYWDRYIRNEAHFGRVLDYIHTNPVKAGLVSRPEDFRWSSAFGGEMNCEADVISSAGGNP
jgi:putative transposase